MSLKNLSRDFAFYGMLDLLGRSVGILLVPIYTRVLSQSSYGDLDLIVTACSALTVLVDMQFVAGFVRLYLERRRTGDGPRFVGTTLLVRILLGTAVAATFLVLGFSGFLDVKFMPSFRSHSTAWIIVTAGIPVSFVFDILLAQAQMLRSKRWFFAGAFGNTLLSTVFCVVLAVFLRLGIVGVVLGQFLGTAAGALLLFIGQRRDIQFSFDGTLLREITRYTLPLVPGWWMGFSSAYISRFFIYGAQGAEANAILAITVKLAGVIGLFAVAFRNAWQPLAMSYIGDEAGEAFYVASLRLFVAGGIFTVFALTALSRPMLAILAPRSYWIAENYVPWFLVAGLIGQLDTNLQLGNQISKKTYWSSLTSGLALTINLIFLIRFTPVLGIYAAGLGLLTSYVFAAVITYFSAQSNHRISYDYRSLFLFATGCCALLSLAVARSGGAMSSMVYLVALAVLGPTLAWLALHGEERRFILRLIASRGRVPSPFTIRSRDEDRAA